jgi:hypothetical protein
MPALLPPEVLQHELRVNLMARELNTIMVELLTHLERPWTYEMLKARAREILARVDGG